MMRAQATQRMLRVAVLGAVVSSVVWCGAAAASVRLLWHKTRPAGVYITSIALSTSGERIAVLGKRPLAPVDGEPRSEPVVLMLSSTGKILWEYRAPVGETLHGIAITPDGRRIFCDYTTAPRLVEAYPAAGQSERPAGADVIWPLDRVAYHGGIYSFGPTGKVYCKTRRKTVEVVEGRSSLLGSVERATRDRLLLVNYGWECIDGLAVLGFRSRVLFRRAFKQGEAVSAALFPDGRSLAIGWWEKLSVVDLAGRTLAEVNGLTLAGNDGSISPDGKYILLRDGGIESPERLAIADRSGRLKWAYKVPSDWSDSFVPSSGANAGKAVSVGYLPFLGQGPQGKSVLLARGKRRVLFKFSGSSWAPKQVELPPIEDPGEDALLSADGTVVALLRSQAEFYGDSGALLGKLELTASPRSDEEKAFTAVPGRHVAFSNPARYVAIGDGPDLWFIEVSSAASKG